MSSTGLGIALGVLLGLRHAFEPDHLTAVSTLVGETRGPRGSALLGALWGIGHTLALVAVGAILMVIGASLPERASAAFELGVAAMLLVLGVRAVVLALGAGASHRDDRPHGHAPADRFPVDPFRASTRSAGPEPGGAPMIPAALGPRLPGVRTLAWRPIAIGVVHGLAGSGALTAIVFANLPSTGARLLYLTLFGLGSIGGMALASGVAGAALHGFARAARMRRIIAIAAGVVSITVGVCWTIPLWVRLG